MATTFESLYFGTYLPTIRENAESNVHKRVYETNRHRIYALSFWMTDNELAAEELLQRTFSRAFSQVDEPSSELLDQVLIAELRALMPLGSLTLKCNPCTEVSGIRRNTLRVHLERAVVQLPPTERMVFLMHDVESYDHKRISRLLDLTDDESRLALHQARLRLRELLAAMVS